MHSELLLGLDLTFGMLYLMRGHAILDAWHVNWTGN